MRPDHGRPPPRHTIPGVTVLHLNSERGWRGGERQIEFLVLGLRAAGMPSVVACPVNEPLGRHLAAEGIQIIDVPAGASLSPGGIRAVRRAVRTHGVRVLHAHAPRAPTLAAIAGLGLGIPLVATRRVDFPLRRNLGTRWRYGRTDRTIAISQAVAEILTRGGLPGERIRVIFDAIDPRPLDAATPVSLAELDLPEDAQVVLCVAALEDHKDHRTLLAAWASVHHLLPTTWLLMAGDGSLRPALTALAADLPRVRLLGQRGDVPNLLRLARVFTLSSHLEGLGSSVMDAMWLGVPPVCTRAGGIPELITDGVDGLLAGVRDASGLGGQLVRVLSDADLHQRLALAGRATARARFGIEHMIRAHLDLYRELT